MQPGEFITSDTHFGHVAVIKYSKRPFSSAYEMDKELIARWNAKVPKNATIYHLGDFSFHSPGKTIGIVNQLHGKIRLIKGNHDKNILKIKDYFEWIKDYYEGNTPDNIKICMFHYACLTWNKAHYGSWMLHGHSHGSLGQTSQKRMDVGVDTHPNLEPYSFNEILEIMSRKEFSAVDHHKSKKYKKSKIYTNYDLSKSNHKPNNKKLA